VKLVVQLPALNEEASIEQVINGIPRDIPGITETRVVVVDDGSTDRTGEAARRAGAIVVRHEQPRGVGSAFRSGVQQSTDLGADIIVTIDADGQFDPADIRTLIQPILDGQADFVTASRFIDPALIPDMPAMKRWGNDFMARWISRMVKHKFHDVSCGFRAYSRNAFLRLVLTGDFTYTHEVFLTLAFSGIPIREVPIRIRGVREHGESRVANNLWNYGSRTALIILRTYRDYKPLRFFSHIALYLFIVALGFFIFLMYIRITTGGFTPHKWAGFVAATIGGASLMVFLAGVVAEMLDRARITQEEALFRIRRLENDLRELKEKTGMD
jgi:glycosyltransferase involved in cell wall biosynthesis